MRFIFKTDYAQDIRLFKHGGQVFWYGLLMLALLAAPWWAGEYVMSQLHFILIYSIVGFGLMMLTGFTGQVSLGHAAFLAVGAYTEALLQAAGMPFLVSITCAALFAAIAGLIVGLPALRLKGIYLAIATLAFNVIVEEIITRWHGLTGGNEGKHVKPVQLLGWTLDSDEAFYYLCLALTVLCCLACVNLLRSPTGRAFVAIRDSEISASCMGVNPAQYKTLAFAFSAALTGVGGALYAHKIAFISPEQFTLFQSIELITIVILGGIGFLHGAVLGAAFIIVLPQLLSIAKGYLPEGMAPGGLQAVVFGLILILFIIFEPLGLYGRWLKIRTYFELFPFYRRGMFRRQKSYMKSERLR
ncbi:MAG TPA: branched-chain amino acid ABC transporter permease [Burkholderiales bacterium]|jgi:branched-chain amino acid transport system permease protein|nr:branched-chain amino acid ABC transporter permease [Burkholderiales bacterium]